MRTLESGAEATACQISVAPGWALTRWRSFQVSPPPVTELKLCAPVWGPSDVRKATNSSLEPVVEKAGDEIAVLGVPWCVATCWSTLKLPLLAVLPPTEVESPLPVAFGVKSTSTQ